MSTLKDLRTRINEQKGKRSQVEQDLKKVTGEIKTLKKLGIQYERAKEIVKIVALQTQKELQYHISDITSLALESIFKNPYQLEVDFVERRDKTECDLWFVRKDSKMKPLSASGGGAVDVASFALRIASWSMSHPRSRATIMLDEPMKHVSEDLREKASMMITEISKKLGIQFIIISHDPVMATWADKTFENTIKKGISKIT
jgi:DNA repair exonuclease SbcCD ATPase subunit